MVCPYRKFEQWRYVHVEFCNYTLMLFPCKWNWSITHRNFKIDQYRYLRISDSIFEEMVTLIFKIFTLYCSVGQKRKYSYSLWHNFDRSICHENQASIKKITDTTKHWLIVWKHSNVYIKCNVNSISCNVIDYQMISSWYFEQLLTVSISWSMVLSWHFFQMLRMS